MIDEHTDIYKLRFELKLLVLLAMIMIMVGEWIFAKTMPDFFSKTISLSAITPLQKITFFFAVGVFFLIIFLFKGYFFVLAKLDSIYKYPVLLIFILGVVILEYGIYTAQDQLVHGSNFVFGIPSIFMSVVIFKELLIPKPKKKED